jgi:hypothetical protein
MSAAKASIQRSLRFSGMLLILGLGVELISLVWEKPPAFLLFAFIGGALFLVGVLAYLFSLVAGAGE